MQVLDVDNYFYLETQNPQTNQKLLGIVLNI